MVDTRSISAHAAATDNGKQQAHTHQPPLHATREATDAAGAAPVGLGLDAPTLAVSQPSQASSGIAGAAAAAVVTAQPVPLQQLGLGRSQSCATSDCGISPMPHGHTVAGSTTLGAELEISRSAFPSSSTSGFIANGNSSSQPTTTAPATGSGKATGPVRTLCTPEGAAMKASAGVGVSYDQPELQLQPPQQPQQVSFVPLPPPGLLLYPPGPCAAGAGHPASAAAGPDGGATPQPPPSSGPSPTINWEQLYTEHLQLQKKNQLQSQQLQLQPFPQQQPAATTFAEFGPAASTTVAFLSNSSARPPSGAAAAAVTPLFIGCQPAGLAARLPSVPECSSSPAAAAALQQLTAVVVGAATAAAHTGKQHSDSSFKEDISFGEDAAFAGVPPAIRSNNNTSSSSSAAGGSDARATAHVPRSPPSKANGAAGAAPQAVEAAATAAAAAATATSVMPAAAGGSPPLAAFLGATMAAASTTADDVATAADSGLQQLQPQRCVPGADCRPSPGGTGDPGGGTPDPPAAPPATTAAPSSSSSNGHEPKNGLAAVLETSVARTAACSAGFGRSSGTEVATEAEMVHAPAALAPAAAKRQQEGQVRAALPKAQAHLHLPDECFSPAAACSYNSLMVTGGNADTTGAARAAETATAEAPAAAVQQPSMLWRRPWYPQAGRALLGVPVDVAALTSTAGGGAAAGRRATAVMQVGPVGSSTCGTGGGAANDAAAGSAAACVGAACEMGAGGLSAAGQVPVSGGVDVCMGGFSHLDEMELLEDYVCEGEDEGQQEQQECTRPQWDRADVRMVREQAIGGVGAGAGLLAPPCAGSGLASTQLFWELEQQQEDGDGAAAKEQQKRVWRQLQRRATAGTLGGPLSRLCSLLAGVSTIAPNSRNNSSSNRSNTHSGSSGSSSHSSRCIGSGNGAGSGGGSASEATPHACTPAAVPKAAAAVARGFEFGSDTGARVVDPHVTSAAVGTHVSIESIRSGGGGRNGGSFGSLRRPQAGGGFLRGQTAAPRVLRLVEVAAA